MTRLCMGCMEPYETEYDICPHCGYVMGTEAEESIHMAPGTVLEGRYIIGKVLGYGGFGITYIGWDRKLEQKVAIKEYLPSEFATRMPSETMVTIFGGDKKEQFGEGLDKFIEEGKRLSKFQNEAGIVKIFDGFKGNRTAYLVMEYLEGETLASYLEREGIVSEGRMMEILSPVMLSLQKIHREGIIHRDIAPENIFLTKNGDVKLIDFGASRYATTSHSRSLTVIIKPGYSPEEQYRSRGDQGPHTDLYALAAVMYKMLTGITPPDALERRAVIETKKKDLLKDIHKVQKDISPQVENAVLNAMNVQIEDRTPTLTAFMDELYSKTPVKRRYGKIKKLDVYAWPMWLKITLGSTLAAVVLTGILLVSGGIDFPSLFSGKTLQQEGMVQVPNLEGMGTEEAIAAIEKMGLQALASGNVESSYIEAGKIVLQKPAASEYIQKGGTIRLTVSSGTGVQGPVNGIATMPYVVWNTKEEAISKLAQAGLGTPVIEEAYDNNVEAGKVISQSIKENEKISVETQVTITISKGIQSDFYYTVKDGKATITGPKKILRGHVVIPEKIGNYPVVAIGDRAFMSCTSLTSIEIPSGITSIGEQAFEWCESLISIEIPNGLTSIGNSAFYYCSSLTSIEIPSGVTSIGDAAFCRCSALTSIKIPGGVTSIEPGAFGQCSSLETVELPSGLKSIGYGAFQGCSALKSIELPSSLISMGHSVFYGCSALTSIDLPNGIMNIGQSVFQGCKSLISIKLPSGLTSIEHHAFAYCSALKSIEIPNAVTSIEAKTFYGCTAMTSINMPSDLTSIGNETFYNCKAMTSIELPSGVASIGERAFYNCKAMTSIELSSGLKSIGDYAFENCSSLKSIDLPDGLETIGNCVFYCCLSLASIEIPNGVTSIGVAAFYSCTSLTNIKLPSEITSIDRWVFQSCTSLTSINIPSGVTSIGVGAFYSCTFLENITLPASLTNIDTNAFYSCNIKTVYFVTEAQKQQFASCFPSDAQWIAAK